jgi:hypothetical protein
MTVGKASTVIVVLGASSVPPTIIPGSEQTTVVEIQTSCRVQAQLTAAPDDFGISPEGFQEQSFVDSPVLRWEWQVSPKRDGNALSLVLQIRSLVRPQAAGADLLGAVRDFAASIQVVAVPKSSRQRATSILNNPFFDALIPVLLTAIGGLHLRRRRRQRSGDRPEDNGSAVPDQTNGDAGDRHQ